MTRPGSKWEMGQPWPKDLEWVPKWARYVCSWCKAPITWPQPHECPEKKEEPKP